MRAQAPIRVGPPEQGDIDMELTEWIRTYELSTGRRMFALTKTRREAEVLVQTELVQHIDEALAHDHQTRDLDMRWTGQRVGILTAPIVAPLDARVDNVIAGLRDVAVAQAKGAAPGAPIHKEVKDFLAAALPAGVYAVTSLPHVEQVGAVERIVAALQGPLAGKVTELNLKRQADVLSELLPDYRTAVQNAAAGRLEFSSVREARTRGQRYLVEIIARILGTFYRSDDPAHAAARKALLGPIAEQGEAVRAILRARRTPRDVDPVTGEPLPEAPEAPEAPEPPADAPAA
jgi:hypothetical protein